MALNEFEAAILLADIAGSTPLYAGAGDSSAFRQITDCLAVLRQIATKYGGCCAQSKGDDVLCNFADPAAALHAARTILAEYDGKPLDIHIGLHFGPIIHTGDDIFGDAVNVTARLTELARPGEVLVSRALVDKVPEIQTRSMVMMGNMTLKGKSAPMPVYSLSLGDPSARTEFALSKGSEQDITRRTPSRPEVVVKLTYRDHSRSCAEGASLTIGRSKDCDIALSQRWVSRHHATIRVSDCKAELCDESLTGTYITTRAGAKDAYPILVRRESALLVGTGVISPGVQPSEPNADPIEYQILYT